MKCFIKKVTSGQWSVVSTSKFWAIFLPLITDHLPLWACPNCKDAIGENTARAFNASILWMIGAVFLVVGVVTLLLRRELKRRPSLPHADHGQSS